MDRGLYSTREGGMMIKCKEGVKALVWCEASKGWHEAVGVTDAMSPTGYNWMVTGPDPDLVCYQWFVPDGAKTAPLPREGFADEGLRIAKAVNVLSEYFNRPWNFTAERLAERVWSILLDSPADADPCGGGGDV